MNVRRIQEIITTKRFLLMLCIVGAALSLRIWGIGFDLPDISHPDEQHEVYRALRLAKGSFEWDRIGKGGLYYVLFVEYGVLFVTMKLAGTIGSPNEFMEMFVKDPSIFWLLGRATVAVLGALNVWLTFLVGRRVGGYAVGVIAAVLLAFCSLSSLHSHLVTVDIPMTSGVLATVLFSLRLYESGKLRDYLWAGFFAAVAVMTKLSAAPIVFVIALAHLMRCWKEHKSPNAAGNRDGASASDNRLAKPRELNDSSEPVSGFWWSKFLDHRILFSALLCLVIYCLGNPAVVVKSLDAYKSMSSAVVGEAGRPPATDRQNQLAFYGEATLGALGWPIAILCAVSFLYCLLRHRPADLLLITFPILLTAAILLTNSHWRHARFILPILPLLFVMAAQLLWLLAQKTGFSQRGQTLTLVALLAILCAPRAVEIVNQDICFTEPATTIQARNWIEENVPSNTKILMLGYPGNREQRRNCPLQDTKENMLAFAKQLEADASEMAAKFVRIKAKSQEGANYDLKVIAPRDDWITLDEAKRSGIRFVVTPIRDFAKGERARKTGRTAFYQQLQTDPQVMRVKAFSPKKISPYDSMWRDAQMEVYEILPEAPKQVVAAASKLRKTITLQQE